jgi:uncharacterized protein YjbI with pentapeptide repeats
LLEDAELFNANFEEAQCPGAQMRRAVLRHADITAANFTNARLHHANLELTEGEDAIFDGAHLFSTKFRDARLPYSTYREAKLIGANFHNANLQGGDFRGADLTRACLVGARMSGARLQGATLRGCHVYGLSAWDVEVDDTTTQADLVASRPQLGEAEPTVRVDDIEVAQFINLLIHNDKIRRVIDTITSTMVLILGRFTPPERKHVLDALREGLRAEKLVPVIFDFDRPPGKTFTETIITLTGLSRFVIVDITNPRSSPLELQATVPAF